MYYNTKPNRNDDLFNEIIEKLHPPQGGTHLYPGAKGQYWAPCPFHDDQQNRSLTLEPYKGLTLQEYCTNKKLPLDFLQSLQVYERKRNGIPQVYIPYFDKDGTEVGKRIRTSLNDSNQFIWSKGSKPTLYGLSWMDEPLHDCMRNGESINYIILVERESDAQTLWFYDIPSLGVPSATVWQPEWKEHLTGKMVYVWQEPGEGGKQLVEKIGQDFPEIMILSPTDGYKDISEYHTAGGNVQDYIKALMESATPYSKIVNDRYVEETSMITEKASPVFHSDVLDEVVKLCRRLGVVGEEGNIKLLYLALTSRITDKPVSIVVKAASSAGKSFILKQVLKLFPQPAYYEISSMSEKALFYLKEPLKYRFLIMYEEAGISSDFSNYIIRSLLSEGHIKHITVEQTESGMQDRVLEQEGPTGFITTTTKINLHPENETRLLSINVTDTPDQTRAVMCKIAKNSMGRKPILEVPESMIAYQSWLEKLGIKEVIIPYAEILADNTNSSAVRMRRDFSKLINLISVHAIIYQHQREKDEKGSIIATLEDYREIYYLSSDSINYAVESSVKPSIRQTVNAVRELLLEKNGGETDFSNESEQNQKWVDNTTLAKKLGLSTSASSRRVAEATSLGFLDNLESKNGKRKKIILGKAIPDDESVFPSPEELEKKWAALAKLHATVQRLPILSEDNDE